MALTGAPLHREEFFDYSKGLNTYVHNDVVPKNMLRYITDARISTLGRYKTRQGCDFYSVPLGETLDANQVSATGAAEQTFGLTTRLAAKIVAASTGRITKVEVNIRNASTATGPVIIQIQSDASGSPSGTVLAQSSIPAASITSSLQYLAARFIEAPLLTSAATYWLVAYIQEDGTGSYSWNSTTNTTTSKTSADSGSSWSTTTYGLQFKSYLSTDSPTLGLYRAYKSDGTKKTLIAHGTAVYSANDGTGATTSIKTGLTANGNYKFEVANDTVYYVNNQDGPRKWDFTTEAANPGTTTAASNLILHKDQIFYLDKNNPTRVFFTDKTAFETFTSTNFLYVPSPKSPDPVVAWVVLNDNLYIFTKKTKWSLYGSDLSNFTLRRSTGLKGSYSQDSVVSTRNNIYFAANDGIYEFNGATDNIISQDVTDIYNAIANKDNITLTVSGERLYVFYTPSGGAQNSKCLVWNINYRSWESIDTATYVNRSVIWSGLSDNREFLQASNVVGAAYYAESSSNTYNNLGRNIEFELRTKYEMFDQPASKNRVKRWYPRFMAQTGNYSVYCQYDKDYADNPNTELVSVTGGGSTWGGGGTWGSGLVWGTTVLIKPRIAIPGRQNYLQRRVKRFGVNMPIEYTGETMLYSIKRAK